MVKIWFNGMPSITSCYHLDQLSTAGCAFSAESLFLSYDGKKLESNIDFNSSANSQNWRIGALNSLDFNVYLPNQKPQGQQWMDWRRDRSQPFMVKFKVPDAWFSEKDISKLLVSGNGYVSVTDLRNVYVSTYSATLTSHEIFLIKPVQNLTITYANHSNLSQSISDLKSRLLVSYAVSGSEKYQLLSVANIYSSPKFQKAIHMAEIVLLLTLIAPIVSVFFSHLTTLAHLLVRIFKLPGYVYLLPLSGYLFARWLFLRGYGMEASENFLLLSMGFSITYAGLMFSRNFRDYWRRILINRKSGQFLFLISFVALFGLSVGLFRYFGSYAFVKLYSPGDDHLHYYSLARDWLASPRIWADPVMTLSKPMFVYLRGLMLPVFGDANQFLDLFVYMILQSVFVYLLIQILLFITYLNLAFFDARKVFIKSILTFLVMFPLWSFFFYITNTLAWDLSSITEIPAWSLALAGMILVFNLTSDQHKNRTIWVSCLLLCSSVLIRIPQILIAPTWLASLSIFNSKMTNKDLFRYGKAMAATMFVIFLIIAGHFLISQTSVGDVKSYFLANTSGRQTNSLSLFVSKSVSYIPKTVPTLFELTFLVLFATNYFIYLKNNPARRFYLLLLGASLLAFNFIGHFPLSNLGYHPRGIYLSYLQMMTLSIYLGLCNLSGLNIKAETKRRL